MKLLLNEPGTTLRKRGSCLTVHRNSGDSVEVPVEDLSEILIAGSGIALSSDVVALAARAGLAIVFLGGAGEPYARAAAPAPAREARLRQQQYLAADQPRGNELARRFVRTKLFNQANLLRYFARHRTDQREERGGLLHTLAGRIRRGARAAAPRQHDIQTSQLLGQEGAAARAYWEGIATLVPAELAFRARTHQDADDAFNAALNYGYGILRARVGSAVIREGLDPAAGFLHAWIPGRESLVFDLMEPFRPIAVDHPLLAAAIRGWRPKLCPESGHLDVQSRKQAAAMILEHLDKPIRCGRTRQPVTRWIEDEVHACATILRGENPAIPPIQAW